MLGFTAIAGLPFDALPTPLGQALCGTLSVTESFSVIARTAESFAATALAQERLSATAEVHLC